MMAVHNLEVIRGDSFELLVGLADGWEDVAADPVSHTGRLVFREAQSDDLGDIIAVSSDLLPGVDNDFPNLQYLIRFEMAPEDTSLLPPYRIVCYSEIRNTTTGHVRRLFEGKVKVRD